MRTEIAYPDPTLELRTAALIDEVLLHAHEDLVGVLFSEIGGADARFVIGADGSYLLQFEDAMRIPLAGERVDVTFDHSRHRYSFSSLVVECGGKTVIIDRPDLVQRLDRRRFQRTVDPDESKNGIRVRRGLEESVVRIIDVSVNGASFVFDGEPPDIGDRIRVCVVLDGQQGVELDLEVTRVRADVLGAVVSGRFLQAAVDDEVDIMDFDAALGQLINAFDGELGSAIGTALDDLGAPGVAGELNSELER